MNDKCLTIYLDDHLALIVGELELAQRCRSSNQETTLGEFLQRLEAEVSTQQSVVADLLRNIGGEESCLKQGAAWMAEKLGRLKLNGSWLKYSALSRLVELQTLEAAATERTAMWETLELVLKDDARSHGIDLAAMALRSQQFADELAQHRKDAAAWAFVES